MTRTELMTCMPRHVRFMWWTITSVSIVYVMLHYGLAIINPFWFREAHGRWCLHHAEFLGAFRDDLLKPFYDKYLMFKRIKEI